MLNVELIELYARVHIGAPVIAINRPSEAERFLETKGTGKHPADSRGAAAR